MRRGWGGARISTHGSRPHREGRGWVGRRRRSTRYFDRLARREPQTGVRASGDLPRCGTHVLKEAGMRRSIVTGLALGVVLAARLAPAASFVTFESGQVRPVALSPDGTRLFAVN